MSDPDSNFNLTSALPLQRAFLPEKDVLERLVKIKNRLASPFYFYDLDLLEKHLSAIGKISPPWLKFWYATKANPMSAILKIVRNLGLGIDVASLGELDQVLRAGIKSNEILATGPAKSLRYMKALLENDVEFIVCESPNQLKWLNQVAMEMKRKPKALLRVQLDWKRGESVLGGDAITPFGADPMLWSQVPACDYEHVQIKGMHVFQWGNILNLGQLEEIWDKSISTVKELAQSMQIGLEIVDLGGGLGIPYRAKDQSQKIDFAKVVTILQGLKDKHQIDNVWLEIGRFATGECGHYFVPVIDRKKVRGQELLILEGGINHMARPALTRTPFPASVWRENFQQELIPYQVHGPLCTALDLLGTFKLPIDIGPGDWLIFHQAGAYGLTESMPFFLCHPMPAEVIMYRDNLMTPRIAKTSADWMI